MMIKVGVYQCFSMALLFIPTTMMADDPRAPFRMFAIRDSEGWAFDNTAPGWRYFDAEGKGQSFSYPFYKTRPPWVFGFPFRVLNDQLWFVDSMGHGLMGPPMLSRCSLNVALETHSFTGGVNFSRVDSSDKNRRGVVRKTVNVSGDAWGAATPAEISVEIAGRSQQWNRAYQPISGLVVLEWPVVGDDIRSRRIRTMIRNETGRNPGETTPFRVLFDFVPLPDDELRVYVLQPPLIAVWRGKITLKRANVKFGDKSRVLPSIAVHWKLVRTYQTPFSSAFHVVTDGDKDLFVVPEHGIFGVRRAGDNQQRKLEVLKPLTVDSDSDAPGDGASIVSDLDRQHTYLVVGDRFLDIHNVQIAEQWQDLKQAPELVRACFLPPIEEK